MLREALLILGLVAAVIGALFTIGGASVKEGVGVYVMKGVVDGDVYMLNGTVKKVPVTLSNKTMYFVDGAGLVAGRIVGVAVPLEPTPVTMAIVNGPAVVSGHVVVTHGHYVKVDGYIYLYQNATAIVTQGHIYKAK